MSNGPNFSPRSERCPGSSCATRAPRRIWSLKSTPVQESSAAASSPLGTLASWTHTRYSPDGARPTGQNTFSIGLAHMRSGAALQSTSSWPPDSQTRRVKSIGSSSGEIT
jgi:hypothetical protein